MKCQRENLENNQLLRKCGFIQRVTLPSLSRDRRIRNKNASINETTTTQRPILTSAHESKQKPFLTSSAKVLLFLSNFAVNFNSLNQQNNSQKFVNFGNTGSAVAGIQIQPGRLRV